MVSGLPIWKHVINFFPKKAVEGMKLSAKRFDFEPEITAKLLKKGYKILEVPITTKPRGYDEGKNCMQSKMEQLPS